MSERDQQVPSPVAALERLRESEAVLGAVEAALGRLASGAYGSCQACGAPLDEAALASDPLVTSCRGCGPAAAAALGDDAPAHTVLPGA